MQEHSPPPIHKSYRFETFSEEIKSTLVISDSVIIQVKIASRLGAPAPATVRCPSGARASDIIEKSEAAGQPRV